MILNEVTGKMGLPAPITTKLKELESFLGFAIESTEITPESRMPHDETIHYALCQRFYGKEKELPQAIRQATAILLVFSGLKNPSQEAGKAEAVLYSLLGNMHYIAGDFQKSLGCFLRAASLNRKDITYWVEILFAIRSLGDFETFERLVFNLEAAYYAWLRDQRKELDKSALLDLLEEFGAK